MLGICLTAFAFFPEGVQAQGIGLSEAFNALNQVLNEKEGQGYPVIRANDYDLDAKVVVNGQAYLVKGAVMDTIEPMICGIRLSDNTDTINNINNNFRIITKNFDQYSSEPELINSVKTAIEDYFNHTGINQYNDVSEKVILFPNPVTETLHFKGKSLYHVTLYNPLGIKITDARINKNGTLNVSRLPGGVYIIKGVNQKKQKTFTKKVIIK